MEISPRRAGLAGILGLIFIAVVAFGYVQSATTFHDSESYAQRMKSCEADALRAIGKPAGQNPDIALLSDTSDYCYNDILNADRLSESTITRGMYIHQRYENNVILFMVVLITLSGVVLAALQMWTSYNLAATGHHQGEGATELTIEQGRLAVKSSVTGLVVLVLSLAFFALYVVKVYMIQPDASAGPANAAPAQAATPAPAAPTGTTAQPESGGGLGPPPA